MHFSQVRLRPAFVALVISYTQAASNRSDRDHRGTSPPKGCGRLRLHETS